MSTDAQTPFLGTPLVPLRMYCTAEYMVDAIHGFVCSYLSASAVSRVACCMWCGVPGAGCVVGVVSGVFIPQQKFVLKNASGHCL